MFFQTHQGKTPRKVDTKSISLIIIYTWTTAVVFKMSTDWSKLFGRIFARCWLLAILNNLDIERNHASPLVRKWWDVLSHHWNHSRTSICGERPVLWTPQFLLEYTRCSSGYKTLYMFHRAVTSVTPLHGYIHKHLTVIRSPHGANEVPQAVQIIFPAMWQGQLRPSYVSGKHQHQVLLLRVVSCYCFHSTCGASLWRALRVTHSILLGIDKTDLGNPSSTHKHYIVTFICKLSLAMSRSKAKQILHIHTDFHM